MQGVLTSSGDPAYVSLLDNAPSLENFCTHSELFSDRQVLLDTCAAETVSRNRKLFYRISPATTPMIINGVNPEG